jgi:Ca2+-binding RTX toxin-like protein
MLLMAAMGATVLLATGVAYALSVRCDAASDPDPDPGQCQGTQEDDDIFGTVRSDTIRALNGFDNVIARAGEDKLYGGNRADYLDGGRGGDTYFGGRGTDSLEEIQDSPDSGRDEMNGGPNNDLILAGGGNDILRGQAGDESGAGDPTSAAMLGRTGNDKLYGGPGDDAMEGNEGADELYGGPGNDFINAAIDERFATDAPDVVNCGDGFDTALVLPNDVVDENCEDVFNVFPGDTVVAAASERASDADQQRLRERFLKERGG